jgi:major intracellular serine protease
MWNQGFKGDGVTIGVIDTGIAPHQDLEDNIIARYNFVDAPGKPTPFHFHGTHVAGTIAAHGKEGGILGVAPEAKIRDYRVLDAKGNGSYAAITEAIYHAADHCDIINMSLGGSLHDSAMRSAIKYAVNEKNVLVVVASGNEEPNLPATERNSKTSYPAYYPEVVGVGCVDLSPNGKVNRAYFSNYNKELDLCADGEELYSCGMGQNDYTLLSGTSMASPVVAGLAALLLCKARKAHTVQISEPTLYAMLKGASCQVDVEVGSKVPHEWLFGVGLATVFPVMPLHQNSTWSLPFVVDGSPQPDIQT